MPQQQEFLFCFTVDTEPDNLWANRSVLTFEHFRDLPEFHERICEAGAAPTYLTTSEVAESLEGQRSLDKCRERHVCEIGAHFHTWTREWPFPVPDLGNPRLHAMAHRLGQKIEQTMLSFTCDALHRAFNIEPRSYRGGRWSLGPDSEQSLRNCGISVDSTITPGINWQDAAHPLVDGPDYRKAKRYPHTVAEAFGKSKDPGSVLEIPVGAAWFPRFAEHFSPAMQRQLARVSNFAGVRLGHRWLRPTGVSLPDLVATMRSMKADQVPVWVFMIHSSEINPCKPLPTQEHVRAFIGRCVDAVAAAVELGAKPVTLSGAASAISRLGTIMAHA